MTALISVRRDCPIHCTLDASSTTGDTWDRGKQIPSEFLVLGLVAGGFVGAKTYEPPPPPPCEGWCFNVLPDLGWVPRMFIGAAIGAGIGAVTGALVGFANKTEQWEEAPPDRLRVSFAPQRDGRFALGVSVRF